MTHKKLMILAALVAVAGAVTISGSTLARGMEGGRAGMAESQKQQVEERKAEFEQRLETAKIKRDEKLTERRLEICEKRQEKVNSVFTKATEQNKKQLAVMQAIEEKVKGFYIAKNLTAEGYDAAVAKADAAEATAVAAVETSESVTFDCTTTDGAKPGSVIKEAMAARHAALNEYRTAVKDLILVVKKHNGQNRDSGTTSESGIDATTETEPTTAGGQ